MFLIRDNLLNIKCWYQWGPIDEKTRIQASRNLEKPGNKIWPSLLLKFSKVFPKVQFYHLFTVFPAQIIEKEIELAVHHVTILITTNQVA